MIFKEIYSAIVETIKNPNDTSAGTWKLITMIIAVIYAISALGDLYHGDSQGNYYVIFILLPFSFIAAYGFAILSYKAMHNERMIDRKFISIIDIAIIYLAYTLYTRIDFLPLVAPVIFITILGGYIFGVYLFFVEYKASKRQK